MRLIDMLLRLAIISFWVFLNEVTIEQKFSRYEFDSHHMGTQFKIILFAEDEATASKASNAAFNRIEELNLIMSDYLPESELNILSEKSGGIKTIRVSNPLFEILERSVEISEETNGFFDITVGHFVQLWRNTRNSENPQLPNSHKLKKAREKIGFQNIVLYSEDNSVLLKKENMQLNLGAIGKGFAADEALKVLQKFNITSALVDGGGDISMSNPPPGKKGWKIAIPRKNIHDEFEISEFLLSNKSIATSGDLFQFIEIDDQKFSHIIDPRTGLGLTHRIQVTVIASDCATADAYASAISVAGIASGKEIVENNPSIEAFISEIKGDSASQWRSSGFYQFAKNF